MNSGKLTVMTHVASTTCVLLQKGLLRRMFLARQVNKIVGILLLDLLCRKERLLGVYTEISS